MRAGRVTGKQLGNQGGPAPGPKAYFVVPTDSTAAITRDNNSG
jgi:hypothetical protein